MGIPLSVCEANYCQGVTLSFGGRSIPDEQCFEAMKAAIDGGATFWNAGVFYGRGPKGEPINLQLIARFFCEISRTRR
jgi:aryl-alcohol dehydrogenase-like predicted oxidoreductase